MNMPKLKARDGVGRYTTKRRIYIKWFIRLLIVFISVNFITGLLVDFNEWSRSHKLQTPIYNNASDNEIISIARRPYIEKIETGIISPVVQSSIIEKVDVSHLDDVEVVILRVFGPTEFKVARAIAKNENGFSMHGNKWVPDWQGANSNGTIDTGIFSINTVNQGREGCSVKELLEVESNVKCAYLIWDSCDGTVGDKQGCWYDWVVFNTGTFKSYL